MRKQEIKIFYIKNRSIEGELGVTTMPNSCELLFLTGGKKMLPVILPIEYF